MICRIIGWKSCAATVAPESAAPDLQSGATPQRSRNLRILLMLCAALLAISAVHAQLYVGPKSTLYIPAGHTLQVDSLTLQPTATLTLSNNKIEKSSTPQWSPGPTHTSIRQVYIVDTPVIFQGAASITYATANLNGNTASSLVMVKAPNPPDSFQFAGSSSVNMATQTVSAVFSTPLRLGKFSATNGGVPLPLIVSAFDAWADGPRVKLHWEVATEAGITQYAIERSADGSHFYPLLLTPASSWQEYVLWDEAPLTPNNYYRLSAKDANGARSYFGVRKVVFKGPGEGIQLSAWPIPAEDELHLSLSQAPGKSATLTVYDLAGRMVLTQSISGPRATLFLKSIAAGSYLLRYSDEGSFQTLRIEKR